MSVLQRLHTALCRVRGWYPAVLGGTPVRVAPYNLDFWRAATAGAWEPRAFNILSDHLHRDTTYYDIGAWIGPTTMYAARRCKQVVCFEPDPIAYRFLLWNLRLNGFVDVLPLNIALADRDAVLHVASKGVLGDSMTTLLESGEAAGAAKIVALSWKTWMGLGLVAEPDFIKLDIEGGEFEFLPSIKNYLQARKPTLYLSTHTPFLEADQRAGAMAKVVDVMAIYRHCYDEEMEPVDPQSLLREDALGRFQSFVLMD